MTQEEKKTITREKHSGRVAQGHKLAALIKKRKEEILCSKEQFKVQSTEQSSVQSTEQPSVQSNGAYVYGIGMLEVFAIGVCLLFAYNASRAKNKKQANEKRINHQNDVICLRKIYNK